MVTALLFRSKVYAWILSRSTIPLHMRQKSAFPGRAWVCKLHQCKTTLCKIVSVYQFARKPRYTFFSFFGLSMHTSLQHCTYLCQSSGNLIIAIFLIEIAVLTNIRRTATIQAQTYCNLYSLEQQDLFEVLKNYPAIKEKLMHVAEERLREISKKTSTVRPPCQNSGSPR